MRLRPATLATAVVLASCAPTRYVQAPEPEHGSAPGMRSQRISGDADHERRYAVVFAPGDEILGGLTEFAAQEHLGAAQITAIGGVQDARLGFFDKERKAFREETIDQQAEVTSLVGDVAVLGDRPVVHVHMNVALADGSVRGGHLLRAHVWPTLEVMIAESPRTLRKQHDAERGLDIIVPAASPEP
jgi:predicted DNA-binding protein with PD1-like motif